MPSRRRFALFSAIFALAAVVAAPTVFAQSGGGGGAPPTPSISVVGEGIVVVEPTIARITLGVDTFDPSLAKAQADAASRMDAVIQGIKRSGILDRDIRTISYSINPVYDNRGDNTQTLRGYQVQNLVDVRSTDVPGLGALLDSSVGAGATRVTGIRFEADDMQRLKDQARDRAMQNARAKAEQLARAAGVAVGRPLQIDESDPGGVTPVRAEITSAAPAAAPAARTPVQAGETQVRTTVRVVWAIQ
ncbi:MAG: SIMPL domain-containing protein [Chloroflexi bacterium]|nr:SIMPL domain-containing protein [Chloroflexota bacterium]